MVAPALPSTSTRRCARCLLVRYKRRPRVRIAGAVSGPWLLGRAAGSFSKHPARSGRSACEGAFPAHPASLSLGRCCLDVLAPCCEQVDESHKQRCVICDFMQTGDMFSEVETVCTPYRVSVKQEYEFGCTSF